ncbi:MAG: enoyl-CoA hydratase/isomerase family protein [Thermoplasmatota archaeon]
MSSQDAAEQTPPLRSADQGGVRTLTLNRPSARNALNAGLVGALRDALRDANRDAAVRCILLTGTPPAFCAGGDVRWMQERAGAPDATKRAQETAFGALARDLLRLEKPIVAAVNGDAYGAGMALAILSDAVVIARNARLGATFSRVALVPDTGASWALPRLVGLRAARRLVLLGDPVDAEEALRLGLVDAVSDDALAQATSLAERLAQGPTKALALAKRALLRAADSDMETALANEANLQALCFALDDHAEGVSAFLEKRPPKFSGR